MMAQASMEVIMNSQFILLMYCLSIFLLLWVLDFKQVLNGQACLTFSVFLLLTTSLLLLQVPFPFSVATFFIALVIKYFFYIQTFRSWLPGALLIILHYVLIVTSWFLTFDLPRIFLGMDIFNNFIWMLLFHIIQQFVLVLLAFIIKYLMTKFNFIQRLYSFTFVYKKIALASLLLVAVLSILRQSHSYPSYTATFFFSLFVIVFLLAVSFFLIWITTEKQNEVAALQMKNQYLASEKEAINKLKDFKHDYKNMLLVLAEYLEQERYQEGQKYLHNILNYTRQEFDLEYYADVYKLQNLELQNYLFAFISKCQQHLVKFTLAVSGQPRLISINPVILVRMIAIISDNALEACEKVSNGHIHLQIDFTEKDITFTMKNSCREKVPLEKIMTPGYSTKEQHNGRGLPYLEKTAKKLQVDLAYAYEKNIFTIVLHFK